jgi:delta 1-pyrroline-5-carboxylate dehydrogenase
VSGSADEADKIQNELLSELYGLQLHLRRMDLSAAAYAKERDYFNKQQEQLELAILQVFCCPGYGWFDVVERGTPPFTTTIFSIPHGLQATADIEARKEELVTVRIQLAQEQDYEALKRQVVKVPARSVTRSEMASVEKEIADLQQQSRDLESLMERRRAQFGAIVSTIDQVYSTIQSDGQQEEAAAVTETPAGGDAMLMGWMGPILACACESRVLRVYMV